MAPYFRFSGGELIGGRMREVMERLSREGPGEGGWSPAVDIYETAEEVVIVAELAGVRREDIKVILDGNLVRISGQRAPTCRQPGARFHRLEISSGAFERTFRIGVPFEPKGVEARCEDGLLKVRLPKRKPPAPHKIPVESA
jgi:HSP20 family protein